MAGWHSLSGYLYYRPGGAFGRIKPRKRYWYVFDDNQGKLLCFKNEEEAKKTKLIDNVDIKDATISLSLDQNNQFIVSTEGKELYLTADNHESMMIWLLGLQAKRDTYVKKELRKSSSDSISDGEPSSRERSLSESKSLASDLEMSHNPVVRCSSMRDRRDIFRMRFQRFGTIDMGYGEERHFAVPPIPSPEKHSTFSPLSAFATSGPSASRKWSSGASGESDDAFLHAENCGISQEMNSRHGSERSASASSDSAIDSDRRVSELERELMIAKADLARSLNQESKYREALEKKDAARLSVVEEFTGGEGKGKSSKSDPKLQEKTRVLQNQNRFLNEEVKKLGNLRLLEREKFQEQEKRIHSLEAEIDHWKRDYLFVLQSTIRMPDGDIMEEYEVKLYGGDRHQVRLKQLLDEAHRTNPSLPSYDSLHQGEAHIDIYGFKQRPENDSLIQHFVCTQLYQHYCHQLQSYERHQQAWRDYLKLNRHSMNKTKELKSLCRAGIPPQHRAEVWTQLVYNQVQDLVKTKGPHYYQNICNMMPDSVNANRYLRQISLDLMRTMPHNIHYNSPTSDGIKKMREVLQAFCVHNPQLGYCQGMNFIVGMALLFMEAEDAFWTLVAITEIYFSPNYFDHNLVGAQADQEVLKEFLREKLPNLWRHLEELEIEISTITLNWFLPIFFDAVPFETLLRIWDCFLLEGPKVLFRFALAILKIHESSVIQKTETITIMRHLKACAKLTFDIEGLVKTAFEDLNPFPRRKDITSKQAYYVNLLKEKVKKREKQQRAFLERERMFEDLDLYSPGKRPMIECAVQFHEETIWVFHGNQLSSRVAEVRCQKGFMYDLNLEFDSRVLCSCALDPDIVLVGTLSKSLFGYCTRSRAQLWHVRLNDAIFALTVMHEYDRQMKIFAALADGTVAVLEKLSSSENSKFEVFYIPVGHGPVTSMLLIEKQLWCATGNTVHILHAVTMDPMDNFVVSTNPYDHILTMAQCNYGVWIAVKGSSIIELWDNKLLTCMMFFDVKDNRYPNLRKEDDSYFNGSRITSVLPMDHTVWIGTGDGNLLHYDVIDKEGHIHSSMPSPYSDSNLSSPYYTSCGQVVKDLRTLDQVGKKVEELYLQRLGEGRGSRHSPRSSLGSGYDNPPQKMLPKRTGDTEKVQEGESRSRKISRDSGVTVIWNNPAFCDNDTEESLTPRVCSLHDIRGDQFNFDPLDEYGGLNGKDLMGQNDDILHADDSVSHLSKLPRPNQIGKPDVLRDMNNENISHLRKCECCLASAGSSGGNVTDHTRNTCEISGGIDSTREPNGAHCNENTSQKHAPAKDQLKRETDYEALNTHVHIHENHKMEFQDGHDANEIRSCGNFDGISKSYQRDGSAIKQGNNCAQEDDVIKTDRGLKSITAEIEGIQTAFNVDKNKQHQCQMEGIDFHADSDNVNIETQTDSTFKQSNVRPGYEFGKNQQSQTNAEDGKGPSLKDIILEAIRQHEKTEDQLWLGQCSLTTPFVSVDSARADECLNTRMHFTGQTESYFSNACCNSSESTEQNSSEPNSSETVVDGPRSELCLTNGANFKNNSQILDFKNNDLPNCYRYGNGVPQPGDKSRSGSDATDLELDLDGSAKRSTADSDLTDMESRRELQTQKFLKNPSLQWDHNIGDEEGFISLETATDNDISFTESPTKMEHLDKDAVLFNIGEEIQGECTSGVTINIEDFDHHSSSQPLTHTVSSPALLSMNSSFQQSGELSLEKQNGTPSPNLSRRALSSSGRPRTNKFGCHSRQMSLDTNASSVFWSSGEERGSTASLKEWEDSESIIRYPNISHCTRRQSAVSIASGISTISTNEVPFLFDLSLQARIKVADKPIRALLKTWGNGEQIIVSCAGCYGDDESVLKWTKEEGEKMWTNEPFLEICPITSSLKRPVYMFNKPFSPRSSIKSESDLSSCHGYLTSGSSPEKRVSFPPGELSTWEFV